MRTARITTVRPSADVEIAVISGESHGEKVSSNNLIGFSMTAHESFANRVWCDLWEDVGI